MRTHIVKRSGFASGFSLVEILVIVVILTILAIVAVPAFSSSIPNFQLRQAVKTTSSLMRMGRMTAANTHKPIRASIDCQKSDPCRVSLYTAVFNSSGDLTSWVELPNAARTLDSQIVVKAGTPSTMATGNPAGLYWTIFLPTGRTIASHEPLRLLISSKQKTSAKEWEISLSKTNGRASEKRLP